MVANKIATHLLRRCARPAPLQPRDLGEWRHACCVPVCCAPETCTSERSASLVVARPPALRAAQAVAAGAAKAALPAGTTFVLGVVAGAFIGFGSFLALSVGGACPGLASANPGLQKMVLVRARWPGRCCAGLLVDAAVRQQMVKLF